MRCWVFLGLLGWLACGSHALSCEHSAAKATSTELERRDPVEGQAQRFIFHAGLREQRGNRTWITMRKGVEHRVPLGTRAVVVHSGLVVSVSDYPGFGWAAIVDHGQGIRTLYGRLDSIEVKQGDCVTTGSVLGRVASPPGDAQPSLHFEVSTGGSFIWPMLLLQPPATAAR